MSSPGGSITLVGKSYFLCAKGRNLAGTTDPAFRNALQHGPNVHHMYLAMADDDSYYIHYHDNAGKCYDSRSLERSYPDLDQHLDGRGVECPHCVSLSPSGYYFMRTAWGRAWKLPDGLEDSLGSGEEFADVWFGIDDSYVAQTMGGKLQWKLHGNYGSLGQTLKYATKEIKALGLNVADARSYVLVWEDGTSQCNPGACRLSKSDVQEWAGYLF